MLRKIFLALILIFLSVTPIFADEKFTNSYHITYQITPSGLANITERVTITNKSSDYYPTSQTFSYHSLNLGNIRVIDQDGEFEPKIEKENKTTTIKIDFRSKNIGLGKQTTFELKYQTSDLSTLNGEVWQILIPGIKNLDFYDDFGLDLELPTNFPEIQYVSVEPETRWHWNKNQIRDKGIFLIFGQDQYYNLSLNYELKNPGLTPILDSITIPPDTNYQKIILSSIDPPPNYSEVDADGNWIFWYKLNAHETKKIVAEEQVKVFFNPKVSSNLTKKQIEEYTAPQKYWDFENFKNLSSKIDNLKTVREIYDFTVNTLQYNFNRLSRAPERFSAYEALKNPGNSICTDFTNVFISLSRKNGIPAREVDGYAETQNLELQPVSLEKDILHAWPEYYDFKEKKWIMVDPTWENTTGGIDFFSKLDLNHVTFVIKGLSSETPYPAGSYKDEEANTKDVNVAFGEKEGFEKKLVTAENNSKNVDLIYAVEDNRISGIPSDGKIIIQSKSQTSIENVTVSFFVEGKREEQKIGILIPYQTHEYKFSFPKINFWERKDVEIKTIINGKSHTKTVHFIPIYLWGSNIWWFLAGGIVIMISFVIMIVFLIKSLSLRKRKNLH